ncbi:MAG: hypothetical protein CME65_16165 [Halobacteriovoraceae bacterium]|nr:hypothetical protein [Halobacteriovoraceae bacterium]|tara:strand:+ start:10062 stop:10373 length:312 start_codon:yes stop_codon:yes gene_type:complete
MKKLLFTLTALFIAQSVPAKTLVRINTIGASPRGQYVAFEEFGYKEGRKFPYSKIRVMNVWKNKYVDDPIQVIGKKEEENLHHVRKKAKDLALKKFKKFNIES